MFEGSSIQRVVLLPVLLVFFFFASCETQKKVEVTPRDFDLNLQNIKSESTEFHAYMYISFYAAFSDFIGEECERN